MLPGAAKATQVDEAGLSSLAVLRLMGLPALQVLVQGQPDASLKDRSAAKKRAHAAVASQVHVQKLVGRRTDMMEGFLSAKIWKRVMTLRICTSHAQRQDASRTTVTICHPGQNAAECTSHISTPTLFIGLAHC